MKAAQRLRNVARLAMNGMAVATWDDGPGGQERLARGGSVTGIIPEFLVAAQTHVGRKRCEIELVVTRSIHEPEDGDV
jgi:hypothetical protein